MATSHSCPLVTLLVIPHSQIIIWLASSLLEYSHMALVLFAEPVSYM
jgi:hypothetical protein